MFKNASPVKFSQSVGISSKMGGYPVQYDTHPRPVERIYQIHKILRASVPGGRCIIARNLIAPGTVEGMLRNTHQLHMGIFHFLQILYQPVCKLTIIVKALRAVRMLHKGADVALINCHGFPVHILFILLIHPFGVLPFKAGKIRDHRRGTGAILRIVGKGIRLIQLSAVPCGNQELIHISLLRLRNKQPPDSYRSQLFHGMAPLVPPIKASDHMDRLGIGRPHSEINSVLFVLTGQMGTQLFVDIIVGSLGKQILICLRDKDLFPFHILSSSYAKSFSVKMIMSSSSYLFAKSISRK